LLDACFEPTQFFSPHSYERHIEQGPVLDRSGVPMAFVGTIMGIHQEDFFFEGDNAEAAALEMNLRMRSLTDEPSFEDVRITVGILEPLGDMVIHERPAVAFRWTLDGEKNHAGATATPDRRDPGVAAARLAGALRRWVDEHPLLQAPRIRPVVGNVRVSPGTNRNVIPGEVSLTLALLGDEISSLDIEDLDHTLRGYAIGTLAKSVRIGGEGMYQCRTEPISYATVASRARLAIDLRAAGQHTIDAFRSRIDGILDDLRAAHGVEIRTELQQRLNPFELPRSGQVLLMERSYGGSHNPNETELLVDITRGCVLQLAVVNELLSKGRLDPAFNLFVHVEQSMPQQWLNVLPRFTSGALHDTCNIAARAAALRS
jgi:acetylornithine deacetylase/succinyl-diaminopimelate desuccinylase-like protein